MKFTYVKRDKIVGIDGEFLSINNFNFDQEVDAIQWHETYGEIEFVNRQEKNNKLFEDINYIQPLIDLWNIEYLEQKKESQKISLPFEFENQKLVDKINSTNLFNTEGKVYVYIHIPKNAGMFIKDLISKHEKNSKIFDPFTEVFKLPVPIRNAPTIEFVKEQIPASNSDAVGFFVVVRNPYSRVYSMWKWLRQNGEIGNLEFPAVPNTFEEFVVQLGQGDYSGFYFMQSQLKYIEGENFNNLKLFKFEDMESIKSFLETCNVGWSEEKINNIPGPNYKDMYTLEMAEIVKNKFKEEFETFNYSTDL
jgi:hypothetical protein